jgi:2-polyprenyl-3-methyl-5-hydroxy-6-metoxy-1,4-benzoquinol methylase
MHGDGQYAPEKIPQVLLAFDPATDAVFASRMLDKKQALHGGMPFYKWIGNQILTFIENRMLAADLSEFHTGFRAYRINSLNQIPFFYNSDGFHFDTEIIIQATAMNWRIAEIQIPTHYGDEKCHVNGIQYAINCIRSVFRYHLVNLGLFYSRNYDFNLFETENFHLKKSPYSLHQFVLRMLDKESESTSIELGAARGVLSDQIAKSTKQHCAVDARLPDLAGKSDCVAVDLNSRFAQCISNKAFDCCIALDLIEHLNDPEAFLEEVSKILRLKGKLYVSSGNISYFVMRAALLLGQFNYGKRGILDRTHKRLFNLRSLKKLLSQYGFQVTMVRGFAPPLTDMIRNNFGFRMMERVHSLFSRLWPNLFAYNFLIVASRMDRIEDILAATCSVREYYKH